VKLIEYEQPTSLPVPKVAAAGIAGVIVTAVVTVLAMSGIIVPDNVSQAAVNAVSALVFLVSAIQTVVTFAAAYLKKDAKPAPVVNEIKRTQVK
jgi:predicted amino acid-binding ACT domain protein